MICGHRTTQPQRFYQGDKIGLYMVFLSDKDHLLERKTFAENNSKRTGKECHEILL